MTTTGANADRQHKEFSPSRMERNFLCPGSHNLIKRSLPRASSPYADEGQVAHEILRVGLENKAETCAEAISHSQWCCEPDNDMFTVDFRGAINDALDYVWDMMEFIDSMYGDAVLFIERFVDTPSFAAPGETGGFCDIAIYSAKARWLIVPDYKHGEGVAKPVKDNPQVYQYASGFLYEDNPSVRAEDVDRVTLVIIQPRAFHPEGPIREHDVTPAELVDYLARMDEQIEVCNDPLAPLVPGISQCQFCDARSVCPALERAAVAVIDPRFQSIKDVSKPRLPDYKNMDLGRIGYCLKMADIMQLWIKGLKGHADELARVGVDIPDHKLVETHPRRKYFVQGVSDEEKIEKEIAPRLAALIGCPVDDVYERKLIGITEAEARVKEAFKSRVGRGKKKKAAEEAAQTFAYLTLKQPSGTLTLVAADDPRPPVNKAIQSFGGVAELIQPPT